MKIKEVIFGGLIIRCECRQQHHVSFQKIHEFQCKCGRTAVPQAIQPTIDPAQRYANKINLADII